MAKIQMLIELDYDADAMHGDDPASVEWFLGDILGGTRGQLLLHSNEIGDEIGGVRVIQLGSGPTGIPLADIYARALVKLAEKPE